MTAVLSPVVVRTRSELSAALDTLERPVRLVPTMGALHAGHAALLAAAGPGAVLSVFVNPLQFGPGEDFERYPRDFAADRELAAAHRVSVIWAPDVAQMYPLGRPQVSVHGGPRGDRYEGAARPGHFDGMLTVVAKLFHRVRPDEAYFGQKDAQQIRLIQDMVRDLDLPVSVHQVPTVREADGLALSSRNRYLDQAGRRAALAIPRALATGSVQRARQVLAAEPGLRVDYCELVDELSFEPAAGRHGRLIIAAYAGATRLIDNELI